MLVFLMKRRHAVLFLVTLGFIAMTLWWLWPKPEVTRANCDRIREGMTHDQIDGIFGCARRGYGQLGPPGSSMDPAIFAFVHDIPRWPEGTTLGVWFGDSGLAVVVFDSNDRVIGKAWHDAQGFASQPNPVIRLWNRVKEWWSPSSLSTMPMTVPYRPPASTAPFSP